MLLWDTEEDPEDRQLYRRRGLFRQQMPVMFRNQATVTGGMYRNFADQCYGLLCSLGLKGLARSLLSLTL